MQISSLPLMLPLIQMTILAKASRSVDFPGELLKKAASPYDPARHNGESK